MLYENDVGSDVDDMEKLLNVENDWDGEVDFPDVMGPYIYIFNKGKVIHWCAVHTELLIY